MRVIHMALVGALALAVFGGFLMIPFALFGPPGFLAATLVALGVPLCYVIGELVLAVARVP